MEKSLCDVFVFISREFHLFVYRIYRLLAIFYQSFYINYDISIGFVVN